jgi:hypothetical protein
MHPGPVLGHLWSISCRFQETLSERNGLEIGAKIGRKNKREPA